MDRNLMEHKPVRTNCQPVAGSESRMYSAGRTTITRWGVDFFTFDRAYVDRLRNGDPATEHHFYVYFDKLLQIKLRARAIGTDKVEDLKQDTFIRVITAVKEGGVRQPERFGAFVNSVCNNVLLEYYRSLEKNRQMDDTQAQEEIPDKVLDLEGMMVSKQCSEQVRKILLGLPARDRKLLQAVFWEEKDKDKVCRDFGVDRNYLRVLLHRAKDKFKAVYEKEQFRALPRVNRIREFAKRFCGPSHYLIGRGPWTSQQQYDCRQR